MSQKFKFESDDQASPCNSNQDTLELMWQPAAAPCQ